MRLYHTYIFFQDQQKAAVELARLVDGTVFPAVSFGPLAHALCKLIPSSNRTVSFAFFSVIHSCWSSHSFCFVLNSGGIIFSESIEDSDSGWRTPTASSCCRCASCSLRSDQAMGGWDSLLAGVAGERSNHDLYNIRCLLTVTTSFCDRISGGIANIDMG